MHLVASACPSVTTLTPEPFDLAKDNYPQVFTTLLDHYQSVNIVCLSVILGMNPSASLQSYIFRAMSKILHSLTFFLPERGLHFSIG